MPRSKNSMESKKKGKEKWEWERTLARTQIPPYRGRTESETPFPSPWAEFSVPTPEPSSLPPLPVAEEWEPQPAIPCPEASPSASRGTGTGPCRKAARVRHSAMYSDRPRRSRRNRGGQEHQSASSQVKEEDAGKASSNELGPTISDTSKFETLSLNDSTDGAVVHAGDMGAGLPDSRIMAPPASEEALPRKSERRSTAEMLLDQPTMDIDEAMEHFCNSAREARAARYKALPLSRQASVDRFEAEQALLREEARKVAAQEQAVAGKWPYEGCNGKYEGCVEKTVDNGNKWMSEEVRVAFLKYIEKDDDLKEFDYEFQELKRQCFHVENYCKIFHHYNFFVKKKEPGSSEWSSTLYFAEVKEILSQKIYFCCPLETGEKGNCHACKNQRMEDLRHPVIGAFDRGSPDTIFPYMDGSDSSDDEDGPVYDEAWRTMMRAAGVRVG